MSFDNLEENKVKVFLYVLLVTVLAVPALALDYTLTDLGFGGACGINDLGQITGWRSDSNGSSEKAFIWSKESGFVDINASRGQAINNLGQIVRRANVWDPEYGWTALSTPNIVDEVTTCAINTNGQIAGSFRYYGYSYDAVMWSNTGEYRALGIPSNWNSWAYDINEAGTVVGEMTSGPSLNHAFMWNESFGLVDMGAFNSTFSRADGINDLGQIVGQYNPNGYRHAFLWSSVSGLTDLGTLTGGHHSQAIKINNNGLVIGWSMYISGNPARHPFVWDKETGMTDLGLFTNNEIGVGDINSRNEIVGYYLDNQGLSHIALWTPVSENVPEPSSLLLAASGAMGLLALRRRR
jgi:probable HAF family extracellular repeat protein